MIQVVEVFAITGEVIERERTTGEETQFKADQSASAQAEAEAQAKAEAEAEATAAAIAHAKLLGFTDQMISVMYPNLGA